MAAATGFLPNKTQKILSVSGTFYGLEKIKKTILNLLPPYSHQNLYYFEKADKVFVDAIRLL